MKRNYVAILLSLALTVSSVNVFASESSTEAASEAATEAIVIDGDAAAADTYVASEQTMIGQVTEISSDSITISLGTLETDAAAEVNSDDASDADDTAAEDAEAATEAGSEDAEAATAAGSEALTLVLSGESFTCDLTEDVSVKELSEIQNITVSEDASGESTDDTAEADEAGEAADAETDATEEAADDAAAAVDTDSNAVALLDGSETIEISSADGILAGDVVALQMNEDDTIASITILSYGTGSSADTGSEAGLQTETESEAVAG